MWNQTSFVAFRLNSTLIISNIANYIVLSLAQHQANILNTDLIKQVTYHMLFNTSKNIRKVHRDSFNIKMPSFKYMEPHYKDKTVW